MFQEFLASPSCSQKNFFCQNIILTLPKWAILIFLQISEGRESPFIKNPTNLGGNKTPHQTPFSSKVRAERCNRSWNREECRVWLLKVLQLLFSAFFFQHLLSSGRLQTNYNNNNHAMIFPAGDKLLCGSSSSEFIDIGPSRPLSVDRASKKNDATLVWAESSQMLSRSS